MIPAPRLSIPRLLVRLPLAATKLLLAAAALVAALATAPPTRAAVEVIVVSGEPVPGGDAEFLDLLLRQPAINAAGQVVFHAVLDQTEDDLPAEALFVSDGTTIETVVRSGQPTPAGPISLGGFLEPPVINDAGQVAFLGSTGFLSYTIQRWDPGEGLMLIARTADLAPDGGTFGGFGIPRLDPTGRVVFSAGLQGTPDDSEEGVFVGDGDTLTTIARHKDPAPRGPGSFELFAFPVIGSTGKVVVAVTLGAAGDGILYSEADGSPPSFVVRSGDGVPAGTGSFLGGVANSEYAIDDQDRVWFDALVSSPGGNVRAIYVADDGVLVELAREGGALPLDGGPSPVDQLALLNVSDQGRIVLLADDALYAIEDGTARLVAADGDPAPGGGSISLRDGDGGWGSVEINDAGQVAFEAFAGDGRALFVHDPEQGLFEIARHGDAFLGGTIGWLFLPGAGVMGRRALNDAGQVVFTFELDDGRNGVARWTIPAPEPAAAAPVALAALAALAARRTRAVRRVRS